MAPLVATRWLVCLVMKEDFECATLSSHVVIVLQLPRITNIGQEPVLVCNMNLAVGPQMSQFSG
jgi:hypothetical protein